MVHYCDALGDSFHECLHGQLVADVGHYLLGGTLDSRGTTGRFFPLHQRTPFLERRMAGGESGWILECHLAV